MLSEHEIYHTCLLTYMILLLLRIINMFTRLIHLIIDPSLTMDNLMSVLKDVKNWSSEIHGLPWCLDIPPSKRIELENMYPDLSQRKPAILQYWLDTFPYPCWERICYALYWQKEYEVLQRVQENFFVGKSVLT